MAYTLPNLRDDIRNYTEVGSNVLSDAVLSRIIQNAENKILRSIDTYQNVYYATSSLVIGNRYVTIPGDLRAIRYAQLEDAAGNQYYLEQRDVLIIPRKMTILMLLSHVVTHRVDMMNTHYCV